MSDEQKLSFASEVALRKSTGRAKSTADIRKQSLFDMVDADRSGQIDKEEFSKLYDQIKSDAEEEARTQFALKASKDRAVRRNKMLLFGLAVMTIFLGISIAANFALTHYAVNKAVTTTTEPTHGVLTTKTAEGEPGAPVKTSDSSATITTNKENPMLQKLPSMGPTFDYMGVKTVEMLNNHHDDPTRPKSLIGFRTTGFEWYNMTDMDLFLENDFTLHITNDGMLMAKTDLSPDGYSVRGRRLAEGRQMAWFLFWVGIIIVDIIALYAYCMAQDSVSYTYCMNAPTRGVVGAAEWTGELVMNPLDSWEDVF